MDSHAVNTPYYYYKWKKTFNIAAIGAAEVCQPTQEVCVQVCVCVF